MGWLDDWLTDLGAADQNPSAPIAKPATVRKPRAEIKTVWVQTRAPRDSGDLGQCEAGYYSVSEELLTMHDESGKPTGKTHRLGPGDNERTIAGRLTLEALRNATSDFNRPLGYSRIGIA